MLSRWMGAAIVAVAACAVPAFALDAGDPAGDFTGSEFINTKPISMSKLKGRVIFYEVFRTW